MSKFKLTHYIDNEPPKPIEMAEVKHGRWEKHPHCQARDVCSVCGTGVKRREYGINPDGSSWVSEESYSYCPYCGAKMEESE